jgi:hypothetical protein
VLFHSSQRGHRKIAAPGGIRIDQNVSNARWVIASSNASSVASVAISAIPAAHLEFKSAAGRPSHQRPNVNVRGRWHGQVVLPAAAVHDHFDLGQVTAAHGGRRAWAHGGTLEYWVNNFMLVSSSLPKTMFMVALNNQMLGKFAHMVFGKVGKASNNGINSFGIFGNLFGIL